MYLGDWKQLYEYLLLETLNMLIKLQILYVKKLQLQAIYVMLYKRQI